MKKLAAVTALSVAFAVSAPAIAADFDMAQPMLSPMAAPAAADWTGFYVSIFGGGAFNPSTPGVLQLDQDRDGNFSEPLVAPLSVAFGNNFIGSHDSGFTAGIGAGYDVQMDRIVVGGIIDIAYVDYADRQSGFSSTPASYTELRELNFLGTVRARAGYLVTDNLLAYVHGGLAVGDAQYTFVSTNPNFTSSGGDDFAVGYQVGGGLETMITENISLGVEYAYTNLGESDFNTTFTNAPFVVVNPTGTDVRGSDRIFDFHTVKATLSYKF
jgi:outer membrane immunogenic protein